MRLLAVISFLYLQLCCEVLLVRGFVSCPCSPRAFTSAAPAPAPFAAVTRSPYHRLFGAEQVHQQEQQQQLDSGISSIEEATQILSEWDRYSNRDVQQDAADDQDMPFDAETAQTKLSDAVLLLNDQAAKERHEDSTQGRCMLGICAPSTEDAVATLKAWVTALELPRGLLHGMDKDGVPVDIQGAVFIKYNTGGSTTFASIRKSGMGFDALWKPGDALVEPYDGTYRGVYFQVELADGEFRQYLLPLDTFTL